MLLTEATFQRPMSALNVLADANAEAKVVTNEVSQSPMGPYASVAVLGAATHHAAALAKFVSLRAHVGYAARSVAPHATYKARFELQLSPLAKSNAAERPPTRSTFQPPRFCWKLAAPSMMPAMLATLATFHPPIFWLNAASALTQAHKREYDPASLEQRVELAEKP
jgi:hypothetical protein